MDKRMGFAIFLILLLGLGISSFYVGRTYEMNLRTDNVKHDRIHAPKWLPVLPPPGYKIVYNEKKYAWVDETGFQGPFGYSTYEGAVDAAIDFHNHEKWIKEHPWKEVKP